MTFDDNTSQNALIPKRRKAFKFLTMNLLVVLDVFAHIKKTWLYCPYFSGTQSPYRLHKPLNNSYAGSKILFALFF